MRKPLIIGAIAVVVIGIAVYLLSQLGKGTIEWHQKEYRAAIDHMVQGHFADRAIRWVTGFADLRWRGNDAEEKRLRHRWKKVELHEKALIKFGFLEERRFLVFNHRAETVLMNVVHSYGRAHTNVQLRAKLGSVFVLSDTRLARIENRDANHLKQLGLAESFIIVAQPEQMPEWVEFVQRADGVGKRTWEDTVKRTRFVPVEK